MDEKISKEVNYLEGKNLIIAVLAIICLAMIGYFVWVTDMLHNLPADKAVAKAITYINTTMLKDSGATAQVSGKIEEDKTVYTMYKFKVKIGEREVPSYVYVTRNGKVLFPESSNIEGVTTTPAAKQPIVKSDNPLMEAFIVSQCPFGLQMQRILNEVVKADNAAANNIKIQYIGSIDNGKIVSMHGDKEAQENLKQICIREEQKDKFYNYLACYMKKGDTPGCLITAGIDQLKLNGCVADPNKGLKYAQVDFTAADGYGVSGSPTLMLNGAKANEFDFGGRSAQAVKDLLCAGFNQAPGFCAKALNTGEAAAGFSETYASADGSGSAGNTNCDPATQ